VHTVSAGETSPVASVSASSCVASSLASAPQCSVIPAELGGQTLQPGCYSPVGAAAFDVTGTLTLRGLGQFTFLAPTTVTTAANSAVVLTNGALCSDVLWNVAGAFTSGATSSFIGAVSASTAITLGATSTLQGSVNSADNVINYGGGAVIIPCVSAAPSSASNLAIPSSSSSSSVNLGLWAILPLGVLVIVFAAISLYYCTQYHKVSAQAKKNNDIELGSKPPVAENGGVVFHG
jgi:hypothetical protein